MHAIIRLIGRPTSGICTVTSYLNNCCPSCTFCFSCLPVIEEMNDDVFVSYWSKRQQIRESVASHVAEVVNETSCQNNSSEFQVPLLQMYTVLRVI